MRRVSRTSGLLWVALVALPGAIAAQDHRHHDATTISPEVAEQIRGIARAIEGLATPESAGAAGFNPVFGWIPTMGTHWVSAARMLSGKRFDPEAPPQLMFSPIGGKQTMVGAAFAYLARENDSLRPASFAGNPPWHEHPDLAPPGMTLVMLHVWFVASPDGPFAGHNPWLPFWALGLTPPEPDRLGDPDDNRRIRTAALALGEGFDTAGTFPRLADRPGVRAVLVPRRDAIRRLVPALDSAQKAGDWARWNRIADGLGAHWAEIRKTYLGAVRRPEIKERIERFLQEMENGGQHQ